MTPRPADAPAQEDLAPIFTLDDLIGRERQSDQRVTSGRASRYQPGTLRRIASELYGDRYRYADRYGDSSGVEWGIRDSSGNPRDATWAGGITAAQRQGYPVAAPLPIPGISDTTPLLQENGTSSTRPNLPRNAINPSRTETMAHVIARRRRRAREEGGSGINSEEEYREILESLNRTDQLYSQPNITGDFEIDWGMGLGENGSGGGASLSRGGNNRRRSIPRSVSDAASIRSRPTSGIILDEPISPMRWEPTNAESSRAAVPLVVRTSGVRRERAVSGGSTISPPPRQVKRQRVREASPTQETPGPPSYLHFATDFTASATSIASLPTTFDPPARQSHLALSFMSVSVITALLSPSPPTTDPPPRPDRTINAIRPVITFTMHPLPTNTDADASALRTTLPIPTECGVHYFEAEVLDQGEEGFMSVGWMVGSCDVGRLVGWDKGSYGWHADDGKSFAGSGQGEEFGEKWGSEWEFLVEMRVVTGLTRSGGRGRVRD